MKSRCHIMQVTNPIHGEQGMSSQAYRAAEARDIAERTPAMFVALFHTGSPAFRNPSKSFSSLAGSAIGIKRRRYDRHFSTSSPGYSAIFWRLSVMNRCMTSRAASVWPRFQSDAARRARASSIVPAMRTKPLAASAKLSSRYAPTAIAKTQGSGTSGLSLRDSRE